ncbi:SDR family NAD(P)-dependent oxidoreductase [Paenibacillus aceris]|uniref:NAD(P)-dependent dehydrogenase (Short-subunit alcohol dehydrogenase family) n=1 Tax=Paenibacillus aceris TaxID=869555 RepID=A0ABS4HYW6_9BACL|nr:glucose 1-dehydrogenase [Paenibacillus aceris]MBP1963129.1 NAD(P)-dependent dehydrogenase (short-subunit alcohol dehydrogenase family) [Paenibacillus aceris]NHW38752.1 SDR family oxidoreductase [Paenibacillus aceris]
MKLSGKVAVITGGASGIGKAAARLFVEQGAKVVISDISDQAEETVKELSNVGGEVIFVKTNVSKEEDIQSLIAATVQHFGKLDIMIANAGIGHSAKPIEDVTLDRWQQMIDINLTGVFLCNKHAIAQMMQQGTGGAIINTASIMGHVGMMNLASYNAAKGGVANFTRSLGVSYAKHGIRINAICPGFIDTPILNGADEATRNHLVALHPIGRLGRAEEIANAMLFLASDDASFVVGTNLMVDGGYTAQ